MVILTRTISALLIFILFSCSSNTPDYASSITELYVQDFQSDDIETCKPRDVDLSHTEALTFFQEAKVVTYKTLHDHYEIAPCYIEGTLKYKGEICEWNIHAGRTGMIKCVTVEQYFACDDCDTLFN